MHAQLLATAISLLCAWSQHNCAALPKDVHVAQLNNGNAAITHFVSNQPVYIAVDASFTDPVAIAGTLAHETSEIQRGLPPTGKDCGEYETKSLNDQRAFLIEQGRQTGLSLGTSYFDQIFGTVDGMTFLQAGVC